MSKPMRLSDLSQSRQAFVRLCQRINHGSVENLRVENAEPVFDPLPVILRDVKLDRPDEPRAEALLVDFVLAKELVCLLRHLDEMKCGTVRHVEVRAGIPRRILMESSLWDVRPSSGDLKRG